MQVIKNKYTSGISFRLSILLPLLIFGKAIAQSYFDQNKIYGDRIFSANGRFYIEKLYRQDEKGKVLFPQENKEATESFTLYRNSNPPEKIWEKHIQGVRNFIISKNANRVIFFTDSNIFQTNCPIKGKILILGKEGNLIKEILHSDIGFDMGCNNHPHGTSFKAVLSGSVRISEDEKIMDVGSMIRNQEFYMQEKQAFEAGCNDFWDCWDKNIPYPSVWIKDQVWRFDLARGNLIARNKTDDLIKNLPFPVTESQPRILLRDRKYSSKNNRFIFQIDRHGRCWLTDIQKKEHPLWNATLDNPSLSIRSAFISNDGSRVVLLGDPLQVTDVSKREVLIFFNENGDAIKNYYLEDLLDLSLCDSIKGFLVWGGWDTPLLKNELRIVTYVKRTDTKESIIVSGNLIDEMIYFRTPHLQAQERLSFDLITGELLRREPLQKLPN
jgi:hypothetical protein